MGGGAQTNSSTVDAIFNDFKGRRAGLIRALTTDYVEFYEKCDTRKEILCLFGFPDERWEVNPPDPLVPPELPEPVLAINFARDTMQTKHWLALVAIHSDAWLLSVAFHFGTRFGINKADRERLFNMMNGLETIYLVIFRGAERQFKDSRNKYKSNSKVGKCSKVDVKYEDVGLDEEEEGKKERQSLCVDALKLAIEDGAQNYPPTFEEVFKDIKGRRAGLIRALTTDFEEFNKQCDPEKKDVGLYGFPSEQWEVDFPPKVLLDLPEPSPGINVARDGMQQKDWLALVAVHSDAWLLSVAFYFSGRFDFNKTDRKRLFNMINDLPTVYEVLSGAAKNEVKDGLSVLNHNSKSKSNSEVDMEQPQLLQTYVPKQEQKEVDSLKDELSKLKIKQLPFLGKDLNGMGLNELWQPEHQLYEGLLAVKDRKEELLLQQLVEHSRRQVEYSEKVEVKDEDAGLNEEEKGPGNSLDGACGENYASDEFLICSDTDADLEGWVRVH